MVTEEQIKQLYADWNGNEAADELQPAVLRATAHYANMNELSTFTLRNADGNDERRQIMTALDVLRLVEGGEFDLSQPALPGHGEMCVWDGENEASGHTPEFRSENESEIRDVLATTKNFYATDEHGNTLQGHDGEWQIAGKDFT